MSISNIKSIKNKLPVAIQDIIGIKSIEKQLITENEETLKTSELLLLQINSGEYEILFI